VGIQLLPLIDDLSIQDRQSGEIIKFIPNWAQREFLTAVQSQMDARKPVRLIILKARQLGMSTVSQALGYRMTFMRDYFHTLVVAHENELSRKLLEMTETFWDHDPYAPLYTPKYQGKAHKAWHETHSSIRIATARNPKAGRGSTPRYLHASEVAFWDRAKDTMGGLLQAIPTSPETFIIMESTANGVGNFFYEQWMQAEAGESDYIPLFFPWWKHPEYTATFLNMPLVSLDPLDEEELVLAKMGVDYDHLTWRRWAIRNLCFNNVLLFHQEYPSTPEEAFIATGTNVFPIRHLGVCYKPIEAPLRGRLTREGNGSVRFQPDISGPLSIYRTPAKDRDWGVYFVSGDPTRTLGGDPACAQVFSRRTLEQVAVWHGRIDPSTFGDELVKLAKYYNDAMVTTEITGPGYATIGRMLGFDYPFIWRHSKADQDRGNIQTNYGWDSTTQSKQAAIGWLVRIVVDHDLTIHDKRTFLEMRDYVTLEGGGYGPASSDGNDDTVTSLAIGVACHFLDAPVLGYVGEEHKQAMKLNQELVQMGPVWESWGEEADSA